MRMKACEHDWLRPKISPRAAEIIYLCQKLLGDLRKVLGVLSEEKSSFEMITASNNDF